MKDLGQNPACPEQWCVREHSQWCTSGLLNSAVCIVVRKQVCEMADSSPEINDAAPDALLSEAQLFYLSVAMLEHKTVAADTVDCPKPCRLNST